MPKEEWGLKHICAACETKFYDLMRNPIACPKCGKVIEIPETVGGRSNVDDSGAKRDKSIEVSPSAIVSGEGVLGEEHDEDLVESVLDDEDSDTVSLEEIADVPQVDET
ncbi:MAG: TIGR02300 family protein [Albidovulum sp.]|nr:TIGR02300 family protein [Albidovulum sp.]